jgi:hypothetical protein
MSADLRAVRRRSAAGSASVAGGPQQAGPHVADLPGDEGRGQVELRRTFVGEPMLCVAQFDVGPVGASEAAEELAVLLGQNEIDTVFERSAQERTGQRRRSRAHHLPHPVERH